METRLGAGRGWLPVTNAGTPLRPEGERAAEPTTRETSAMEARPLSAATIETHPPAPALTVVPPSPARADDASELAELRERLAAYEAFDQLINDNVARSAQLFRALYEERERLRGERERDDAERQAAAALEADRRLAAERERMQGTLMSLMDEASRMQRQIDGLIQRIAEAITEFTVWLPPDQEPGTRHAG